MLSTRLHTRGVVAFALLVLSFSACRHKASEPWVAEAFGNYLYLSDLDGVVGEGTSPEDSVMIVDNYINQWILQTVILEKAKNNIDDNFDRELQNYKNSLITYAYEQQIVSQLLDTNVTDDEIGIYYNEHSDDLVLHTPIVKALFVKLVKDSPAEAKVCKAISGATLDDEGLLNLQKLASVYASDYDFDIDSWKPFYIIQNQAPIGTSEELNLKAGRCIAVTDSANIYFVRVLDVRPAGAKAPLELEYDNIRTILINHRKIEIVRNLQRDLLKEAELAGRIKKINEKQ